MNSADPVNMAEFRRRAEERLANRGSPVVSEVSAMGQHRLVHELELCRIELELLGEELRDARRKIKDAAERYADLYDFSPLGYLTLDRAGSILSVNLAGALLLGADRAQLIGKSLAGFVADASAPTFEAFIANAFGRKGKESCEVALYQAALYQAALSPAALDKTPPHQLALNPAAVRERENAPLWVHFEATVTESGQECRIAMLDISECRKAEYQYLQTNRHLRTIREIDYVIVHASDRSKLLREACRILVESAQLKLAWIGFLNRDSGYIEPMASAGFDEGYTSAIKVRWDNSPEGWGPCGTAIRTGENVVFDDLERYSSFEPWRQNALKRGYRSSAAFPLRVQGSIVGVLAVYSDTVKGIDARDVAMLEELAMDLGHALKHLTDSAVPN